MTKNFLFHLKSSLFLRYLNFRADFFAHIGKRLHEKTKVNLKIHDIISWETNNYNISRIKGKSDNVSWSVTRIFHEKYFSLKIIQKMRQGD